MSIIYHLSDLAPLFAYLQQYYPISQEYKDAHLGATHKLIFRKTKFVLSPIQVNECIYFVVKGLLRGFIKHQGKEITTWLSFDEELTGAIRHPDNRERYSVEYIQALENSSLIAIPYALMDSLNDRFPEANIIGRKLAALELYKASERAVLARIPQASNRYARLMENSPKIFDRVPLYYLASYLGMRNETLSRVKTKASQFAIESSIF